MGFASKTSLMKPEGIDHFEDLTQPFVLGCLYIYIYCIYI